MPSSPHPPLAPSLNPPSTLSPDQQQAILDLLAKGASPVAACQHLGLAITTFNRTVDTNETFRQQLPFIQAHLSQNIAAALYRSAMEGNITAMTFWLKASPPPGWTSPELAASRPVTFDETLDRLSDADLAQLARAMGVDLPRESETGVA